MPYPQGYFVVSGKLPQLEIKLCSDYVNVTRGTWGLTILSVHFHYKRMRPHHIDSTVAIYSNSVRGIYYDGTRQVDIMEPLGVFSLSLKATGGSYCYAPARNEHIITYKCFEKLHFRFVAVPLNTPLNMDEEVTVYFTLRKLN